MENSMQIICIKCNVPLKEEKTNFQYLGYNFNTVLLRCPICGQVFIPEDLVSGKMSDVEKTLEEK